MQAMSLEIFSPWQPGLLSWSIYTAMVLGLLTVMLVMAWWLGERRRSRDKDMPYECGIVPTGSARFKISVSFYLVAVFFLIFDIESAYIFQWAIAANQLGIAGWLQISFFIFVLIMSLFYVWAKGGLSWGESRPRKYEDSRI
jgi:NADH-quinone oxidoreductase subunit A